MPAEAVSVNLPDLSVDIGFPCGSHVPAQTTIALARTVLTCALSRVPIEMRISLGSSIVTYARNRVLHEFLKHGSSRLFWIDSDIDWEPRDFLRILALTGVVDAACAIYPCKNDRIEFYLNHPDLKTFELHPVGLVKIQGAGLGFCCLKREVIERVSETKPLIYDPISGEMMRDVFRLDIITDNEGRQVRRGEDMAFLDDVRALGYELWLDPRIRLGHVGSKSYRGDPVEALHLESVFRPSN